MSGRRRPSVLAIITAAYLVWALLPMILAIRVALSEGDSVTSPHGFTLQTIRFALRSPDFRAILARSLALASAVALVATPIGAGLALGLHHWRARGLRTLAGLTALAVITPQIALAISSFYAYIYVLHIHLQTPAVFLGHVTLAIPFVVLVVRARLLLLPVEMEEMALDLGAPPTSMVRRVLIPMSVPAIIAAAAIAFTLSFDNIVLSHWLCIDNHCLTLPSLLRGARGVSDVSPGLYALGTIGVAVTLCMMTIALLVFSVIRRQTRSFAGT